MEILNSRKSNDQRRFYKYSLGGMTVCFSFYSFFHHCTKSQLQKAQTSNKDEKDFTYKKKGNNKLASDAYSMVYSFLKNYFKDHVQPNPQGNPKEHLLPSSFSWRKTCDNICDNYKKAMIAEEKEESSPISWGSFQKFYKNQFPSLKKLGLKTDFCDLSCKLQLTLKESIILGFTLDILNLLLLIDFLTTTIECFK